MRQSPKMTIMLHKLNDLQELTQEQNKKSQILTSALEVCFNIIAVVKGNFMLGDLGHACLPQN